jgi:energy-coupling factor transporter ATP-binding protein EcfA2
MNEATAVPTSPQDASRAISTSLVDQDEDFHLETRGLTKQFSGFFAVRDVNLRVRKGTIPALIGPNGAGKTTCFNLLTKFLQPTEGHILFKGKDITATAPRMLHASDSFAPFRYRRCFRIDAVASHRGRRHKARSPRRARRKPLKPLVQGRPDVSGEPVVTMLVCFFNFAREAAGASRIRLSLRPRFSGANRSSTTRVKIAAGRQRCVISAPFQFLPGRGD